MDTLVCTYIAAGLGIRWWNLLLGSWQGNRRVWSSGVANALLVSNWSKKSKSRQGGRICRVFLYLDFSRAISILTVLLYFTKKQVAAGTVISIPKKQMIFQFLKTQGRTATPKTRPPCMSTDFKIRRQANQNAVLQYERASYHLHSRSRPFAP